MQQEQDGADLAAVRRAAQDLVSLQRAAEGNLDANIPGGQRADRQTDLSEGVARVADSLYTLAARTPFISPKLGEALGRAMESLSSSGKEMAGGNRQRGEESGRQGSEALNEAVLELRQSESSMCKMPGQGAPGGSGKSMAERMGDMGERQGQLNRETKRIAQRLSEQMRLSSGDRAELERLSEEQARIRQQIGEMQSEEENRRTLLGRLDQAQREMKEVEEALREGNTDGELQQKQQRILSRMLDAQRSVNRRDFDPDRESRPGEDLARSSPPEIPAERMRESDRLRLDLLKAEADRYPAQYRALIETYFRSLSGSGR
jgi:DNA repair exonuclease SbcCD ATPase subunit